jgi:metal-responsive CopG/Arc/MetJ family transcriptional regulator
MKHTKVLSASLSPELASKIDIDRGDISRSRFLYRIVQQYYESKSKSKGQSQSQDQDVNEVAKT